MEGKGRARSQQKSPLKEVSAEIMEMLADLSRSAKDVLGTLDNLGKKMEGNVKNLNEGRIYG